MRHDTPLCHHWGRLEADLLTTAGPSPFVNLPIKRPSLQMARCAQTPNLLSRLVSIPFPALFATVFPVPLFTAPAARADAKENYGTVIHLDLGTADSSAGPSTS